MAKSPKPGETTPRARTTRSATTKAAKAAATSPAMVAARGTAAAATAATKRPASGAARGRAAPAKPIDVYFWPTPNGQKVTIMLEECGLPYRIVPVNLGKGDQFKKAFLALAPNNRMPAIVDPAGPGGKPIALFESGAILRYLGEKTGKFYPKQPRARYEVDVWLFWQMAGLGPMAGQAHHFRHQAPETIPYAVDRYTNEVNRLYGVLDKRLKGRDFICDRYSIADMASWPWVMLHALQGQDIGRFKNLRKWLERVGGRKATLRGFEAGQALRQQAPDLRTDEKARAILFGQRAR